MTLLILVIALALDIMLGEPRRWHPLVGFGRLADWIERHCRRLKLSERQQGALAWLLAVAPLSLLAVWLVACAGWWQPLLEAALLYLCIGGRSLTEHARRVATPLLAGDLDGARAAVGMMVSRDTTQLDQTGVVKSTVESVLENGSDAQFAPIFWFLVAGAPGAVVYRLMNTLDAMWGYRNDRYRDFGYAAAKLDDVVNWLPARLCAFSYAVAGRFTSALKCWREQAPQMDSPNGGPVMAAGAGALDIQLGGAAIYHNRIKERPLLGTDNQAQPADIERAIALFWRAVILWLGVVMILEVLW